MSTSPIRWGILGTANIARKNWQAIHLSGNGVVTAVASRDRVRAERFIAECQSSVPVPQPPRAMGSYAELIDSPDVYMGSFEQVVSAVLSSPGLVNSPYPLEVCFYPNTP